MLLKNKVALVTGAAKGIGKGIALELASEGCKVVVSDIDLKGCQAVVEELSGLGFESLAIGCDVSKKLAVQKLITQTKKKFGRLDILVNNAGIFPFVGFDKMTEKDWDKVIDVNLKSIFFCCQQAIGIMNAGGRIINVSSIASIIGFAGLTHYCASKAGMNGLTRALALELAAKGITVNVVAPGAIETPGASKASTPDVVKQTIAMIPLARQGKPSDIAGAVAFLASEKASYITGQVLVVDGGWTLR